ncbi:MAG: hypothetical protein HYY13_08640 [Nitrospirae bacterium]|nr:hypothetical protein [Nitrospirota bacterium]
MRPTAGDILNGTKQLLQEVILPFVMAHPDDPEQSAVMENVVSFLLLLEHGCQRWDRFRDFLEGERADLLSLCSKIESLGGQADGLGTETSAGPATWEGNKLLKERFAKLLTTVPAGRSAEARAAVRELAQRMVRREKEWVEVGEVQWD